MQRGGGAGEAQQCDPDGFQMLGRQAGGPGRGESCFVLSRDWKDVTEEHRRLCRGHEEVLVTGESPLNAPYTCMGNVTLPLCPPAPTKNQVQMEMLILKGPPLSKTKDFGLFSEGSHGPAPTSSEMGMQLGTDVPLPKERW